MKTRLGSSSSGPSPAGAKAFQIANSSIMSTRRNHPSEGGLEGLLDRNAMREIAEITPRPRRTRDRLHRSRKCRNRAGISRYGAAGRVADAAAVTQITPSPFSMVMFFSRNGLERR